MKRFLAIMTLVVQSFLLSSCSSSGMVSVYSQRTRQVLQANPTFKNYIGPILNHISHHTSISNFTVQYTRPLDSHNRLSFYTYKIKGSLYQGLVLMDKSHGQWGVEYASKTSRVSRSVAFTQMDMAGIDSQHRAYFAVGGIISNASIRAINIYLVNNTLAQVPILSNQKTYFFVNKGSQRGVTKIVGVNSHGTPVYKYQ